VQVGKVGKNNWEKHLEKRAFPKQFPTLHSEKAKYRLRNIKKN